VSVNPEPRSVDDLVTEVVRAIPEGYVTTYGAVARQVGLRSPRQVGAVLARGHQPMPWHRVLPASGRLVEHLATEQARRLRAEGVEVVESRVDLERYRWR
jgi:methylated-DNA-[protein]-cysteine S-methyltransferase